MSVTPAQTPVQSRRVYSIQTLLRFGQKAGCLGLHTLRLSPDMPWAHVLKFANMDRKARTENPPLRQKSDDEQYPSAKTGFRFKSTTDPAAENRPRFSHGLEIQVPPVRQPDNPPFSESLQRVMGFAKFLKAHTSPQDKRVTAGGRIVPVGPKSPPPTFQVEHLDTVLRTAEKSQRQLEVASDLSSEQKVHAQNYALSEPPTEKSVSPPAINNVNDKDEVQYQQFGWLKLDKSFRLIEQLTLGTAIVKLGASNFHASTKGPHDRVHFQTVSVQQPQPPQLAKNLTTRFSSNVPGNTSKPPLDAPNSSSTSMVPNMTHQAGDYQFHPMLAQHDRATAAGFMVQAPYQAPSTLPLSDFGNLLPSYAMHGGQNGGHHHEWTNSSSSQAKHSDDFLNNRFSAIPMDTWSIDTLSALRTATEAYMQACSFLKEHEKYTALNESRMGIQELQFAIEKKRHLILAREACRQRKDSLEATQAEQLQRLRDLEAQHLDHWQTQHLSHITYDGASIQNPSQAFGGPHLAGASEHDPVLKSADQQLPHAKAPVLQNPKSLSPRAPEFVPAMTLTNKSTSHQDEKTQRTFLQSAGVAKSVDRVPGDESKALILLPRDNTVNVPHHVTPEDVRQALKSSTKGPMQLEQEATQRQVQHHRNHPSDPDDLKRTKFYLAAQARRSEQPTRRSKLSARGSITESAGRCLADFASQQTGAGIIPRAGDTKTGTNELSSSKDLKLPGNGAQAEDCNQSKSEHDEDADLPKKSKSHVRFGINECIAAFEASSRRTDSTEAARDRPISSSESGADRLPMYLLGWNKTKALRGWNAPNIRDNSVAAEVEGRIRQEQQKTKGLGNERKGINLGVSSASTHLFPDFQGSYAYSSTSANATTGQVFESRSNANRFTATPPGGAAMSLRSTLTKANMDARLRGGLGVNFSPSFYGDMDQAHDMATPTRLDLGRSTSRDLRSNHMNHQMNSYPSSVECGPEHIGQAQVLTQKMSHPLSNQHAGLCPDLMVQFPMADPSQLPLDIYRLPHRVYTPAPAGRTTESSFC